MTRRTGIRTGQTCTHDPREAASQLHAAIAQPDVALVIFFCSSEYDLDALTGELNRLFGDTPLVGCTTAGEIGPLGYRDGSLSGVSFSAHVCTAAIGHVEHLREFSVPDGQALSQRLLRELEDSPSLPPDGERFALLFVDGLSAREEMLAYALQLGLRDVPLIGGSAGDGLRFATTRVYCDGCFRSDSAALRVAQTPLPIATFKTQHFVPTDERLVVTSADPARRRVKEINGLPAAEEYAHILGVSPAELDVGHFAASPVVVLIDGADYVRSIQKVNGDGSLTFYCAIEDGLVLRIAHGVGLVADLEQALSRVRDRVGPPQLVLTSDCILRKQEMVQGGLQHEVEEILRRSNAVGFSTYGEQYCGVHVNQTLTGISFVAASEVTRNA